MENATVANHNEPDLFRDADKPERSGAPGTFDDFDPARLKIDRDPAPSGPTPGPDDGFDPFAPERLRLPVDYAAATVGEEVKLAIPVRKPDKATWFRVCADSAYKLTALALESGDNGTDREIFIVDPGLAPALAADPAVGSMVAPRRFVLCQTRQGVNMLWPLKLPRDGDRPNPWTATALAAAELAESRWIRLVANMDAGVYDAIVAKGDLGEPRWPDLSMGEVLKLAFKNRYIGSIDHPVLRDLRGEA